MNEAANDSAPPAPITPQKLAINLLVMTSGTFITRPAESGQPAIPKIKIPLNTQTDQRLFMKNGELLRPYRTFEFKHRKTMDVSGIDLHIYYQASVTEFDVADTVPVEIASMDKIFDALNSTPSAAE